MVVSWQYFSRQPTARSRASLCLEQSQTRGLWTHVDRLCSPSHRHFSRQSASSFHSASQALPVHTSFPGLSTGVSVNGRSCVSFLECSSSDRTKEVESPRSKTLQFPQTSSTSSFLFGATLPQQKSAMTVYRSQRCKLCCTTEYLVRKRLMFVGCGLAGFLWALRSVTDPDLFSGNLAKLQ